MPAKIVFYDKDGNVRTIDQILSLSDEGRLTVLSSAEWEVHEGNVFSASVVDITLGNADTLNIGFKTSSHEVPVHLYADFTTLVGGYIEILEGATWTANTGTILDIHNRKREIPLHTSGLLENKTYTPTFVETEHVLENVDVIVAGTPIYTRYAFGAKGRVNAGDARAENEMLLRSHTQYVVRFTAVGAANMAQIIMNWIEH